MSSGLCCNDLWCECAPRECAPPATEDCCTDLLSECHRDCASESGSSSESGSDSDSDSSSSSSESGSSESGSSESGSDSDSELDVEFRARVRALAARRPQTMRCSDADELPAKRHRGAVLIDLTAD